MYKKRTCKDCMYYESYNGSNKEFVMKCARNNKNYKTEKICWLFKLNNITKTQENSTSEYKGDYMHNKDEINHLNKCFNMNISPDNNVTALTEEITELNKKITELKQQLSIKEEENKFIVNKLTQENKFNKYINVCPVCANYTDKDADVYKENVSKYRTAYTEYFICPMCKTSFKLLDVPNEYVNYTREDIGNKRELEVPAVKDALYELENKFETFIEELTSFKNEINELNNIS